MEPSASRALHVIVVAAALLWLIGGLIRLTEAGSRSAALIASTLGFHLLVTALVILVSRTLVIVGENLSRTDD